MKVGNWYKFFDRTGEIHIGQYTGRQKDFECCICGKGCNAHTFNIYWNKDRPGDWETWGYGPNHLPKILEDLGGQEEIIEDV